MIAVDIIIGDETQQPFPLDVKRLENYAVRILESNGITESDVNIVFIDDRIIAELNERYKGRKGPTDVLSFKLSNESDNCLEGEVYVCMEAAKDQADEYGVPYEEEIVRLVTHGLLHLTGRVHDSDAEYKAMTDITEKFISSYFTVGE